MNGLFLFNNQFIKLKDVNNIELSSPVPDDVCNEADEGKVD